MDAIQLQRDAAPQPVGAADRLPESGFLWLDYVRGEAQGWVDDVERLTGTRVLKQHEIDSFNGSHVSFYDRTPNYQMVIFEGLGPDAVAEQISTRTAAFFLFDRLLVTIRESDGPAFSHVKQGMIEPGVTTTFSEPLGLVHQILDVMVDRYLAIRGPLRDRLRQMQDDLLDPKNPFNDYQLMLTYGRRVRKLNGLSDMQLEVVDSWRGQVGVKATDSQTARLNDLEEHIHRLRRQTEAMQAELEAALQLHFSATAHRTNEIVQTLTVISAIFLPLTLVAGIFGMNFEYMPELKIRYAYHVALAGMTTLAFVLLGLFRRRRYF